MLLQRIRKRELGASRRREIELGRLVSNLQHEKKVYVAPISSTYQPDRVAPLTS